MALNLENYSKAMGKLIAQAWQDPSFVAKDRKSVV